MEKVTVEYEPKERKLDALQDGDTLVLAGRSEEGKN